MRPSLASIVLATTVLASACADDGTKTETHAEDVVHVHELLAGPAGNYFLATHLGLYRVTDNGPELVGSGRHDLMSATMTVEGRFLASGHPDLRSTKLRRDEHPPLLGLVESDTGETWEPVSLLGEADFHGLRIVDGVIYAADSTSEGIAVSADDGTSWETRAAGVQLIAFAIDPTDATLMVGVDLDDGLVASSDGGRSWDADGGPAFVDLEWTRFGQVGLTEEGVVYHRPGAGQAWTPTEGLAAQDALGTDGDAVTSIALPSTISRSDDGGRTWQQT